MPGGRARGTVKPPGDRSKAANGHETRPTASGLGLTCTSTSSRVPAPILISGHLINGFSRKEASACNLAAQGNPIMGGIELWGIIVLASAGSSAQAPHHSAIVLSSGASGGAAPPHHSTGGARSLLSELVQRAAPMTPSLKIITKTCWSQTDDICLCGQR